MKHPPLDPHTNFEASKFSADGFLGDDTRSIEDIIADDRRALEQAGVTLDALAHALESAYQKTRDGMGAPVEIAPGVIGEFEESRGRLPCPFRGCGVFEKGEARLTDTHTGNTLIVTSLGIHLIAKHGFFQGTGSRYRIDPRLSAAMLLT